MFFFGTSVYTFLKLSITNEQVPITPMKDHMFQNLNQRLLIDTEDSFMLNGLENALAEQMFTEAKVFVRQEKGLLWRDFQQNSILRNKFRVVSTFKTAEEPKYEFVALLEGTNYPIYVFGFNIEGKNLVEDKEVEEVIDLSAETRSFLQFLSNHLAIECRVNIVQKE